MAIIGKIAGGSGLLAPAGFPTKTSVKAPAPRPTTPSRTTGKPIPRPRTGAGPRRTSSGPRVGLAGTGSRNTGARPSVGTGREGQARSKGQAKSNSPRSRQLMLGLTDAFLVVFVHFHYRSDNATAFTALFVWGANLVLSTLSAQDTVMHRSIPPLAALLVVVMLFTAAGCASTTQTIFRPDGTKEIIHVGAMGEGAMGSICTADPEGQGVELAQMTWLGDNVLLLSPEQTKALSAAQYPTGMCVVARGASISDELGELIKYIFYTQAIGAAAGGIEALTDSVEAVAAP